MILIGIDPGTKTGVAVWDTQKKAFDLIETAFIHDALTIVSMLKCYSPSIEVYVEDPNSWKPFGNNVQARAKLQGAGSIKRDFAIWRDFCKDQEITLHPVKLQGTIKKVDAGYFEKLTGWKDRTSEHARDAAMLVFGR
jgi:hypothetical protein